MHTVSFAIAEGLRDALVSRNLATTKHPVLTSGSAMAEGPRDALVSRNSATTKYPYCMALFA